MNKKNYDLKDISNLMNKYEIGKSILFSQRKRVTYTRISQFRRGSQVKSSGRQLNVETTIKDRKSK